MGRLWRLFQATKQHGKGGNKVVDKVAKRCKMATKQHGNTATLKPRYSVAHKATTWQSF